MNGKLLSGLSVMVGVMDLGLSFLTYKTIQNMSELYTEFGVEWSPQLTYGYMVLILIAGVVSLMIALPSIQKRVRSHIIVKFLIFNAVAILYGFGIVMSGMIQSAFELTETL